MAARTVPVMPHAAENRSRHRTAAPGCSRGPDPCPCSRIGGPGSGSTPNSAARHLRRPGDPSVLQDRCRHPDLAPGGVADALALGVGLGNLREGTLQLRDVCLV